MILSLVVISKELPGLERVPVIKLPQPDGSTLTLFEGDTVKSIDETGKLFSQAIVTKNGFELVFHLALAGAIELSKERRQSPER